MEARLAKEEAEAEETYDSGSGTNKDAAVSAAAAAAAAGAGAAGAAGAASVAGGGGNSAIAAVHEASRAALEDFALKAADEAFNR